MPEQDEHGNWWITQDYPSVTMTPELEEKLLKELMEKINEIIEEYDGRRN